MNKIFFKLFCMKSSKYDVYFTFTAHLHSDSPHLKSLIITCDGGYALGSAGLFSLVHCLSPATGTFSDIQ